MPAVRNADIGFSWSNRWRANVCIVFIDTTNRVNPVFPNRWQGFATRTTRPNPQSRLIDHGRSCGGLRRLRPKTVPLAVAHSLLSNDFVLTNQNEKSHEPIKLVAILNTSTTRKRVSELATHPEPTPLARRAGTGSALARLRRSTIRPKLGTRAPTRLRSCKALIR